MDLYAILGVSSGASKDEIRAAYRSRIDELAAADAVERATPEQLEANRSERARLNEAWNVLSDPSQRARYDEGLGAALVDGEAGDGASEMVVPATTAADAPPRTVGPGPLAQRSRRKVIDLPAGTSLADTRPRLLAMVFDLTVVIFLVFMCQLAGQQIIKSQYPAETAKVDAARSVRTDASKALTKATDAVTAAQQDLAKAQGDAARAEAKAKLDDAKAEAQRAEKADTRAASDLSDAQGALQGPGTAILVASAVLGLLYLAPSTAITGRTLGMRLRRIMVVRIDGSPATWGGSFVRFLIPVAIATSLFFSLPGLLLGLGCVLFWLWDVNRQGLHDRLARTLVVDAPVSKRP